MPENIIEKIKKLLSLATSSNEHEAALAAARAQELMIKYAVEQADLEKSGVAAKEPIGTEAIGTRYRRIPTWQPLLAYILAPHFFCRSFYCRGVDTYVVGRPTDRMALIATFNYLKEQVARLAEEAWAKLPKDYYAHGKAWKRGFYQGCIQTIQTRLSDAQKQLVVDNTQTAIVLVDRKKEVDDYMDAQHKDLKKNRGAQVNADGYYQGASAGWKLNLDKRSGKALKE